MQSEKYQEKYRQIHLASLKVVQYEAAKQQKRYKRDASVRGYEHSARDFEGQIEAPEQRGHVYHKPNPIGFLERNKTERSKGKRHQRRGGQTISWVILEVKWKSCPCPEPRGVVGPKIVRGQSRLRIPCHERHQRVNLRGRLA